MKNLTIKTKNLSGYAFGLGIALVVAFSSFAGVSKADDPQLWGLKDEASGISTEPEDYQISADNCDGSAEFCGFLAQEDLDNPGQPLIENGSNLESDLEALQNNPSSQQNTSGD